MRRARWYSVAVVALLLAAVGVALREWPTLAVGQFDPGGGVIALASLAVGVAALWFAAQAQQQADADVTAVAARLAVMVGATETKARQQLLGWHDQTIDVDFAFRGSSAHNIVGAAKTGNLHGVVDYYRNLRPRRLMITGAAGSGKTVLAIELILGLLDGRALDDPVPVRLSAATLDTERPHLSAVADWLTKHLVQAYSLPEASARHLVAARMVLPVLDGLDEMDAADIPGYTSRAAQAIRACNAYLSSGQKAGIVATCRIGQYEALGAAYEWVQDAARVELRAVTLPKARAFLTQRASEGERWKPVLNAIRPGGNKILRKALSTPWRLALVATVYEQRDPATGVYLRDPVSLTSSGLNSDAKIRDHLLSLFIPAATALHSDRYPASLAHQWLATLAAYLNGNMPTAKRSAREIDGRVLSGTDIILLELWPLAGSRLPRALPTILTALGWGAFSAYVFTALPASLSFRQIAIVGGPLLIALWLSYASWARTWPALFRFDFRQLRTRSGQGRAAIGIAAGLAAGLSVGLAIGSVIGFVVGLAAMPSFGLAAGLTRTNYTPAGPNDALKSSILVGLGAGASAALVAGLTVGLTAGLPVSSIPGPVLGLTDGLIFGFAGGFAIGLAVWLAYQPQGGRYIALLFCTRRWTRLWLPWRLGRFLDWCYSAGLLRIAGIGYQFRHRELQDYLANQTVA